MAKTTVDRRAELIGTIVQLAGRGVFRSFSEIYGTCCTPGCRCQGPEPKYGPRLQIGRTGADGKTTGCYVPIAAQPRIRAGAADGQALQALFNELGAPNRDAIFVEARGATAAARRKRPGTARTGGHGRRQHAENGT